jgi:hypothetical protein
MEILDGSRFAFEFVGADKKFISELEAVFPEDDVVVRSSFSGAQIVSLVTSLGKGVVEKLAGFLIQKKKTEADRTIEIKYRDNSIKLQGFGGDDVVQMEAQLVKLIHEMKGK